MANSKVTCTNLIALGPVQLTFRRGVCAGRTFAVYGGNVARYSTPRANAVACGGQVIAGAEAARCAAGLNILILLWTCGPAADASVIGVAKLACGSSPKATIKALIASACADRIAGAVASAYGCRIRRSRRALQVACCATPRP